VSCGVHRVCEEFLARKRVALPFESLRAHLLDSSKPDYGRLPVERCWRVMFAYLERGRNYLAYEGVVPRLHPDDSAENAMKLCVSKEHWDGLSRKMVLVRYSMLPKCPVARSAFAAYRGATRFSHLVLDSQEAVRLFAGVYRDLARGLAEPADGARAVAAIASLPNFKAGHVAGAQLVLEKTGRIVFLAGLRKVAHRHALAAATWEAEMSSWRSLGRCCRSRGPRHDQRKLLDRGLTLFRYFALFECYSLCPQCGLRNAVRPLAWPLERSLGTVGDFCLDWLPPSGVLHRCQRHQVKSGAFEYAVPDLMAQSPVPGSSSGALRWTFWPRYLPP